MTIETLIISAITISLSAAVTAVVSTIIKKAVERKMDDSLKLQAELLQLRADKEHREKKSDIEGLLKIELAPINNKLNEVSNKLDANTEGTITLLREAMKQGKDNFLAKGYASSSDVASWHELYNTYRKLGGNHFREYVDSWKDEVDSLPREAK